MAKVIATLKIMPESPDVNLEELQKKVEKSITDFAGETETKAETEPIAFGLNALNIIFVMEEEKGSTEDLENAIADLKGVNSVEVTDVRRAIG